MGKSKRKSREDIELDGRTLEGGGQLLRIAFGLSALTGVHVSIDHIRGNRPGGGGLKAQHLACVDWLGRACNAKVSGAEKGSKALSFTPGTTEGVPSPAFKKKALEDGNHVYECRLDIGTAGSTGLALQAILPFILFSKLPTPLPIHVRISGGTNVSNSPSFEYIQYVLLPTLSRIGFPEIKATLNKRGWSQGGGSGIGSFTLEIPPRNRTILPAFKYRPSDLSERPTNPSTLKAIILTPLAAHKTFTEHLLKSITSTFGSVFPLGQGNLSIIHEDSKHDKRLYIILIATISTIPHPSGSYILARDFLFPEKVKSFEHAAEKMTNFVTKALYKEWESGAWVDEHMRDQLIIYQALAKGESEVFPGVEREPSLHARTAEWVCKQILGVKFDAEGSCEGNGFGEEGGASRIEEGIEQLEVG